MPIPNYAKDVPVHLLVKMLCKGKCGKERYARVSKYPWSKAGHPWDADLFATCLMCNDIGRDNYNWRNV